MINVKFLNTFLVREISYSNLYIGKKCIEATKNFSGFVVIFLFKMFCLLQSSPISIKETFIYALQRYLRLYSATLLRLLIVRLDGRVSHLANTRELVKGILNDLLKF